MTERENAAPGSCNKRAQFVWEITKATMGICYDQTRKSDRIVLYPSFLDRAWNRLSLRISLAISELANLRMLSLASFKEVRIQKITHEYTCYE